MKLMYKVLLEKGILSFDQLVLTTFKELKLSSLEALALMKLFQLLSKHISLIKPSLFAEMMNISPKEAETLLNQLIEKGYLAMELSEIEGKSKEVFNVNFYISEAFRVLEKEIDRSISTHEDELIQFIEDTFQKPLIPTDLETIGHILKAGRTIEEIKQATLDSISSPSPSIRTIQKNLYKAPIKAYHPPKTDVLSEVKKLWEK